jgi:LysR family transcriptional regulator, glycine cleavage system transcriptional activator
MSLTIENLSCFLEAARRLNFRAASQAVALSPAALGQRIRQLEVQLGHALFRRNTRTVWLTEEGRLLVPLAERALRAVDDCRTAHSPDHEVPVELTLGTRQELGLSWIEPQLETLERKHPGLALHLYVGAGEDLLTRVQSGQLDLAVTSARITSSRLEGLRLHQERYCLVAHPRLHHPLKTRQDAGAHTLFDVTSDLPLFRYWRDAPGGIDSVQFGKVTLLGTIALIRAQVLRRRGVAVLPEYFISEDLKRGRLIKLFPRVHAMKGFFRLVFRASDPKAGLYASLAEEMRRAPLA